MSNTYSVGNGDSLLLYNDLKISGWHDIGALTSRPPSNSDPV